MDKTRLACYLPRLSFDERWGGELGSFALGCFGGPVVQIFVRDNNVDQALKALKKKMQREGSFPGDEAARSLRKAVGEAGAPEGGGVACRAAQAGAAQAGSA